ncbi:TPA: zf-HC2 domain-containing protein [Candidatus Poribacteria bacterium]|nr:zf-HC2 domain-containing protein [Candidatus Poribacteria bacterium]
MRECNKISILYGFYVYGDLKTEEKNIVEEHISRCENCALEVDSLRGTLQLLQLEPEPSIPQRFMDNFETNVYRRIAAEMIPNAAAIQPTRRRIFADFWERFLIRPSFLLRAASIVVTLGVGILIGTLEFSPTPKIAENPQANIISTSSVERLEQHFQAESYRQLENALLTRYVAGDELRAMEILNRLRDENPDQQMTSMVAREQSELRLKNGI